jgi:hypothetical protein
MLRLMGEIVALSRIVREVVQYYPALELGIGTDCTRWRVQRTRCGRAVDALDLVPPR